MIRKHIFIDPNSKPEPDLMPNWVGYTCIYCGKVSGLDAWQLKTVHREMAKCPKSPKRAGFFEWLMERINCLSSERRTS